MSALTDRFDATLARLAKAAAESGRQPEDIRLVAVSKLHGATPVAELARHWAPAGSPVFGESYAQEAAAKIPEVAALLQGTGTPVIRPEWHFIGHVQSRKAKEVAGRFTLIHSVDSIKLAQNLQKAWESHINEVPVGLHESPPTFQDILLQVNIGDEPQKSGVGPDELEPLLLEVAKLPALRVRGLMCMAPVVATADEARPYFKALRLLRDTVQNTTGLGLPHLSMGMSHDFEAAVAEGATLVRIGTDIFGAREY